MSNIAEGHERDTNREFRRFLTIAKGSIGEVRSLGYVGLDMEYFDTATYELLIQQATHISRQLAKLIAYLDASNAD